MSNHASRNRNLLPPGHIKIWNAVELIRRRMFRHDVPEAVLIAAQKNVNNPPLPPKVETHPTEHWIDPPCRVLFEAIRTSELAVFATTEKRTVIFTIPKNIAADVLARAGIGVARTRESIAMSFKDMMPMSLLRGLDGGVLQQSGGKTFSLILKETEFDDWLGRAARQHRWPVDKEARRNVGRPERVSVVKSIIKVMIEAGKWRGGMPFKELTYLVNANLKGEEVSRATVESALKQLYAETGDLSYRHRKRKRRASTKQQNKHG